MSAVPRSTSRTRADVFSNPCVHVIEIESGNPAGCASADHSRNSGLRTRRITLVFVLYAAIRYGPVAGTGRVPVARDGVEAGTA